MEFEKEKQYMFVDFRPIDDCREPESHGEICIKCNSPRAKDWRFIKGYFEGCPLIVENIATFKIFEEVKDEEE